jgi:hypothetical protein
LFFGGTLSQQNVGIEKPTAKLRAVMGVRRAAEKQKELVF